MSTLADFKRQRAKVVVPATPSVRRLRRALERKVRLAGQPRAFRGIVPRPDRLLLMRSTARLHERHNNVMDPFRFKEYRHPQARKLERMARKEAADLGWNIAFDGRGVMYFLR